MNNFLNTNYTNYANYANCETLNLLKTLITLKTLNEVLLPPPFSSSALAPALSLSLPLPLPFHSPFFNQFTQQGFLDFSLLVMTCDGFLTVGFIQSDSAGYRYV